MRPSHKYVLRMVVATLCIAGAVTIWISLAEALQKLNREYKQPYFMIYFVHSFSAVMYVIWMLWRDFPYCFNKSFACNRLGEGTLLFKPLAILSGLLGAISLASGYTWYLSLTRTSIPTNTGIYQCASAMVFVISVPLLRERVTVVKVLCVILSIVGVFLVAFFSANEGDCSPYNNITNSTNSLFEEPSPAGHPCHSSPENSTPLGYVLLLVSVICYSFYETLYKKFGTKKDDPAATFNGLRVVGYMGVHTLLWMWPPIVILHLTGFETFQLPPSMEIFGWLVFNGFMHILFTGCLFVCIAFSSPLFASVGTVTIVPGSVIVDLFVQHYLPRWQAFVGIILILFGFIGFVVSEFIKLRREGSKQEKDLLLNENGEQLYDCFEIPASGGKWKKLVLYLI